MPRSPVQRVLALDLQQEVDEGAIAENLPSDRSLIEFFRLTEHLPAEVISAARERNEFDFAAASLAVQELVRSARHAPDEDNPVGWYVWGRAPLPLFAQLGHDLSAWAGPVTLLNQRKDGTWDELRIDGAGSTSDAPRYFDVVEGLTAGSEASGRIAVFVSVMGNAANKDALRDLVESQGHTLSGIVEVRTSSSSILDSEGVGRAASELAELMSQLSTAYPYALRHGVSVFVAGPAHLAFVAGRAINRNIVATLSIPNFAAGNYVEGVELPLGAAAAKPLDVSQDAVARRNGTRGAFRGAFESVRDQLQIEHLPTNIPVDLRAEALLHGLRELHWSDDAPADGFALRIPQRELAVGEQLIDALSRLNQQSVHRVARQLVVHELFHHFQALTHANYRQLGRAGVVLEEIDFWADVFAVQALAALRESEGSSSVESITAEIDSVLLGIQVFDQSEQGPRLERLYERRLRRYLIWYLQRARAATLMRSERVAQLFSSRLIVELVPTSGILDPRGDKLVHLASARTQLVVLCDGRLERFSTDSNVDPALMVEHVRTFNESELNEAMNRVVGLRTELLAPWAALEA